MGKDFDQLSHEEQLDLVLEKIKANYRTWDDITHVLNIDSTYCYRLIQKIIKDKYIDNLFNITPEGKIFIGYVKKRELEEAKEKIESDKQMLEMNNLKSQLQLNLDTIRKNKYDRILSLIAIFISALALIISIFKY